MDAAGAEGLWPHGNSNRPQEARHSLGKLQWKTGSCNLHTSDTSDDTLTLPKFTSAQYKRLGTTSTVVCLVSHHRRSINTMPHEELGMLIVSGFDLSALAIAEAAHPTTLTRYEDRIIISEVWHHFSPKMVGKSGPTQCDEGGVLSSPLLQRESACSSHPQLGFSGEGNMVALESGGERGKCVCLPSPVRLS
jgi:hypothetical protein